MNGGCLLYLANRIRCLSAGFRRVNLDRSNTAPLSPFQHLGMDGSPWRWAADASAGDYTMSAFRLPSTNPSTGNDVNGHANNISMATPVPQTPASPFQRYDFGVGLLCSTRKGASEAMSCMDLLPLDQPRKGSESPT